MSEPGTVLARWERLAQWVEQQPWFDQHSGESFEVQFLEEYERLRRIILEMFALDESMRKSDCPDSVIGFTVLPSEEIRQALISVLRTRPVQKP